MAESISMQGNELFDRLLGIIRSLSREKGKQITPDMRLIEDLRFDSLTLIQLITQLEEQFDIRFTEQYLLVDKLNQVGSLYRYLKHLAGDGNE